MKVENYALDWMIRGHMDEVLEIEADSFQFPWSEEDFINCLRKRNCIGRVATGEDGKVAGYVIYELHKNRLHILNLAVKKENRRTSVARSLVEFLINKLQPDRRPGIMAEVRETNLDAQVFFRQMGFHAVAILNNFYNDTSEPAYLFSFIQHLPAET